MTKSSAMSLVLLSVVVCLHLLEFGQHQAGVAAAAAAATAAKSSMVSCAKDYMLGLVKSKIIRNSQLVSSFNEAMERVRERYEQAEAGGQLTGKDEAEQSAFRYRLVVEELHQLRARFETDQMRAEQQVVSSEVVSKREEPSAEDKLIESCLGVSGDVDRRTTQQTQQTEGAWSPDAEDEADDIRELELWNELEDLERQAHLEDEMGLSISPEVRDQLKKRTMLVLNDLLNNEIRQLALSVLGAYISGGPMGGLVAAVSGSLKLKIVEYLMNAAMDIINSLMGHQIQIKPVEAITPSTFQPISADDLLANVKLAA